MDGQAQPVERARIGPFEVNFSLGEVRKNGIRLKIHEQPLEIMGMLASRPGELVTREEIRQRLWPSGTFVDFDNGLNSAVNRLRCVLGDSADAPKFIETIPRRGYRLIAPVERFESSPVITPAKQPAAGGGLTSARWLDPRWLWAGAAVFGVAVAVTLFAIRHFSSEKKPALNFQARDWVLITNFENRTGEPVFDGTVEHALERELSNSQFVNVVPRERINDTLRLMRKPLDSKIDPALGREICLRDGGIRVLLSGRAEKMGTTYVLSAELVDPTRGVTVASISEEDPADSRMAATVRRLSDRVRETLGERRDLVQQSDDQLAHVTTPSLRALQLYTEASKPLGFGSWHGGAELLEQAVREDPDFASAHLSLGSVYLSLGREQEGVAHLKLAFDLAGSVTERERLTILGTYYDAVEHDSRKAIKEFETLLQLYPDDGEAVGNLIPLYRSEDRFDDSRVLVVHFADMNPGDLGANVDAVQAKAISEEDWRGAQPYLDRARALVAQEGDNADEYSATWIKLLPVYQDWLQGNVQRAHDELVHIERTSPGLDSSQVGPLYGMFGCLKEEAKHYQVWPFTEWAYDSVGLIEFERGNWGEVKTHLHRLYYYPAGTSDSMLMARVGMWSDVERILKRARSGSGYELTAGELALDQGNTEKGVALLEAGLKERASLPINAFFLGSESLARAYEKQGKFDDALRILLQASAAKPRIFGRSWPAFWMRTELQLADLYRKMGRASDAEKVEDELSKLLIYADPDHPILVKLRDRFHTPAVLATN